ncbi:MAG: hypothetical protein ABSE93_08305 [Terriglobia bacterium]|jgi:hypothetical protein
MSQPPFSVFLDIYGYRVAIRSSLCPVLENLAQDFAFFRTEAEPADSHTIELLEGDPPYDKISDAKAVVYTPRNVSYRSGTSTIIDYSGHALGIHEPANKSFRLFSREPDFLYEAAYLFLLSQAGEALDAQHLHRVHALGISIGDSAALVLLPMGGGKSTMAASLLRYGEIGLLSDDSPLIDGQGDLHAFPLRLGILPGSEGAIPPEHLRRINRMEFGTKILVNYSYFAGRVRPRATPRLVFLGERSLAKSCSIRPATTGAALRAMIANCVVGLGLFQGMEFVFQRGPGEVFKKAIVAWARLRASWHMLRRSRSYHLVLGRDPEANARMIFDLLTAANNNYAAPQGVRSWPADSSRSDR